MVSSCTNARACQFALTALLCLPAVGQEKVRFNRDVRPILANHCVKCHGRNASSRRAGLRLDNQADAHKRLPSGSAAIVPGNPAKSELLRRVSSHDAQDRMPPTDAGPRLTKKQIDLLRRWIRQGGRWEQHWSYQPIQRPRLPTVRNIEWVRNPIDRFVLAKLEQLGWQPRPLASRTTIAKRLAFGLTGLPLSDRELRRFEGDKSPAAFRRLVGRLLASPSYGERMATHWLDLARYADTHGYHTDSHRDMWRWRDWVIGSFNRNMPFDRFTTWQLAGDLLPNATMQMKLATGFHRNTMIMFENGVLAEEYLNEYVVDRVVTTGTVWLGQTLECCRCHDHKYDPLTQRDFYQLYAYFNSIAEKGIDGQTGNASPVIPAPTPAQQRQLKRLASQIALLGRSLKARRSKVTSAVSAWEIKLRGGKTKLIGPPTDSRLHLPLDKADASFVTDAKKRTKAKIDGSGIFLGGKFGNAMLFNGQTQIVLTLKPPKQPLTLSLWVFPTIDEEMGVTNLPLPKGEQLELLMEGNRLQVTLNSNKKEIKPTVWQFAAPIRSREWQHIALVFDTTSSKTRPVLYHDGIAAKRKTTQSTNSKKKALKQLIVGASSHDSRFRGMIDDLHLFHRQLTGDEVSRMAGGDPIRNILAIPASKRSAKQQAKVVSYYLKNVDPTAKGLLKRRSDLVERQTILKRQLPTSMVMSNLPQRRPAFILARGDYRQKRQRVYPATPSVLPKPKSTTADRLGLARWLVSRDNPLTARVVVNRLWQLHFGVGLVKTSEDFGVRGEWPSHPKLLDWLAAEFIDSGWNLKHIHTLIVSSSTYRQSSITTLDRLRSDPENRLLARGPRLQLTAEMVRDQALAKSGLLVRQLFGPSVYPYQPPGLWKAVSYNPRDYSAQIFKPSVGAGLYRRSVYTFWKRSVPPPAMAILGAPTREICTVRRSRTNTPLQALLLMNDVTFVEAARVLAEGNLKQYPQLTVDQRASQLFRHVVGRNVRRAELQILRQIHTDIAKEYRQHPLEAKKLCTVGSAPCVSGIKQTDVASWTAIISLLLNLDETVMRN